MKQVADFYTEHNDMSKADSKCHVFHGQLTVELIGGNVLTEGMVMVALVKRYALHIDENSGKLMEPVIPKD